MKRIIKILLALVLLLALGAGWLLRTRPGQARLEQWVRARLPADVTFRELGGRLPFDGRIGRMELRDGQGVWLAATNIEWNAARFHLRRRLVRFDALRVDGVDLIRPPDYTNADRTTSRAPEWSASCPVIDVERLVLPWRLDDGRVAVRAMAAWSGTARAWTGAVSAVTRWRDDEILLVGSVRSGSTGMHLHVRHLAGSGWALEGGGAWLPDRRLDFSGSFTNAALLQSLAGIEASGAGHVAGRVVWTNGPVINLTGVVERAAGYGLQLHRAGIEARWQRDGWTVAVFSARGAWRDREWRLAQPASIHGDESGLGWNLSAVEWAGLTAHSGGRWSKSDVDGWVDLQPVSVADTPWSNRFASGLASGRLEVFGPPAAPRWELALQGSEWKLAGESAVALKPAEWRVRVVGDADRAHVKARLMGWTREPLTASATVPLRVRLNGQPSGLDRDAPISAELRFDAELEELLSFADLRGTTASGRLSADLAVAGTWAAPRVSGGLALRDGRAVSAESGAHLRDVQLVVRGDEQALRIETAQALDGSGGRITGQGTVRVDPDAGFPIDAGLEFRRAMVWRRDGSRVRLDGRLAVLGQALQPLVTGRLDIVDSEIRIRPAAPSVPVLPIAAAKNTDARAGAARIAWPERVGLDVIVRGREIQVAGRGLESTWRADLRVKGTAAKPQPSGLLAIERGYFLFMGRRFALDRGTLSLDGRWPASPLLDLSASSRAGDMMARLYAAGPVDAPTLQLESEPAYPVDEILARLLFGRSTDAISPLQAVRLAHGLNVLRGKGRTLDLLDRGQSVLRVDQLELVQSESDAGISAISVGKYVGRNVYVEGEKSLSPTAPDQIVLEVELTPSLILTTETSPRIREGIGLKWRRDY